MKSYAAPLFKKTDFFYNKGCRMGLWYMGAGKPEMSLREREVYGADDDFSDGQFHLDFDGD